MYVKPALGTKITVARASLTNDTKGSWRASTATRGYVHFFNATQCLPAPVAAYKPTPVAATVACAARCEIAKAQAVCLAGKMTADTCAAAHLPVLTQAEEVLLAGSVHLQCYRLCCSSNSW
jgi:hypothetical protein